MVDARQALINMGDIAVSLLRGLAEKGSETAMEDLVKIGTSHAREILNSLLHSPNENVQRQVALILAELEGLNNQVF